MANKQICSVDVVDSVTDEDKILVNIDGKLRQIKASELNSKNSNLNYYEEKGYLSRNYLKQTGLTAKAMDSSGEAFSASDWLMDEEFKPYTNPMTISGSGYGSIRYCLYKADKSLIRRVDINSDSLTIEDTEAKYIRVCYVNTRTQVLLEDGNVPHSYSPYAPSNFELNESLSDYGMDNKFDGVWEQGYPDESHEILNSMTDIHIKNTIPCTGGVVLNMLYDKSKYLRIAFYNASNQIIGNIASTDNSNELKAVAPSGTSYIDAWVSHDAPTTPSTSGKLRIYVGNEIDQIKNDLTNVSSLLKNAKPIDVAPTEFYSYPFTINTAFTIGSVTFPKYAYGYYITFSGANGCLIAYHYDGSLYVAYRNGGEWQNPRKI